MPKLAKEVQAVEVARLKREGLHMVGVVPGPALQVKQGSRSRVLDAMVGGKRRDMGLGAFPGVTLAKACEWAREAREETFDGVDPIAQQQ